MPEPDDKQPQKSSLLKDYAKAESMIQIAIILPAACVIGWFLGGLMDKWLHTSWISIVGILVGAVAGFVQVIRVATGSMEKMK